MTDKIIQKNLSSDNRKDFKKSNLDILTEENDRLLKSLKRPGGSYKAAQNQYFKDINQFYTHLKSLNN